MSAREKISRRQFRRVINALCRKWRIPEYSDDFCARYWPAFSRLEDEGQRAFWQVLGVQEESLERRTMPQITSIILYPNDCYVHDDDTDIKRGYVHGYHVNQEATIDLLRFAGADEISVIVHDNDRDIPAVRRLEQFSQAGYTFTPTPIEGPMTWRLRRIQSD
jgi:hypothetical protein